MSVQGSAGIQVAALSRSMAGNPVETTAQRPREAGAPGLTDADTSPTAGSREELQRIIAKLNQSLEIQKYDLRFEIADDHRIIIRVVNSSTGEILRQIPPEDLLRGFQYLDEITGVRMDSKV